MMRRHSPAQGFLQFGLRTFNVRMCQCSKADWIRLAGYDGVEHCSSALAEHIRQLRFDLDVGILERLVNALGMTVLFPDQLLAGTQQHAHFLRLAIWDEARPDQAV